MPGVIVGFICLVSAIASAQESECEQAEALYQRGFKHLVEDWPEAAIERAEAAIARCPTHPHASELSRLALARITRQGELRAELRRVLPPPGTVPVRTPDLEAVSGPSVLARAELILVQTLNGAILGTLICNLDGPSCTGQASAGALLAGAASGGILSALGTLADPSFGQVTVINSGSFWGYGYGLAISTAAREFQRSATITLPFGLLGTGVGVGLSLLNPDSGRVALANSGGIWAAAMTGWVASMFGTRPEEMMPVTMTTVTAGIIGGAFLWSIVPVSRPRSALIDLGGAVGTFTGALLPQMLGFRGGRDSLLAGALGATGTVAGLSLAAIFTRDLPAPELPVQIVPQGPHGSTGLTVSATF